MALDTIYLSNPWMGSIPACECYYASRNTNVELGRWGTLARCNCESIILACSVQARNYSSLTSPVGWPTMSGEVSKTESLAEIGAFLSSQFSYANVKESIKDNKTTALCITLVFAGGFYSVYKKIFEPVRDDALSTVTEGFAICGECSDSLVSEKKTDRENVKVNRLFFRRMWKILTIILPLRSRAFLHLVSLTVLLYYRTLLR